MAFFSQVRVMSFEAFSKKEQQATRGKGAEGEENLGCNGRRESSLDVSFDGGSDDEVL